MAGTRRVAARDKDIGQRVRVRRLEKGLSQTELAMRIGVSFQQVQKYENGRNRISASRLQRIAELLDVPITFFFEVAQTTSGDEPLAYLQKEGSLKLECRVSVVCPYYYHEGLGSTEPPTKPETILTGPGKKEKRAQE
jgi:transcriptional regulator with XRE-family HTH domain